MFFFLFFSFSISTCFINQRKIFPIHQNGNIWYRWFQKLKNLSSELDGKLCNSLGNLINWKGNYGFETGKWPPCMKELADLESAMMKIIKNIEFRKVKYIEKDKLEQQFHVSAFEALENFCWSIEEKCFLICGYCFIELCVKPNNISTSIFRFMSLIFGVFKSTLNSLQSIFGFTFRCVEYFFDSFSWMELRICFMAFGGWFDKLRM